jgi:membrane associated rhomboid family serine protease
VTLGLTIVTAVAWLVLNTVPVNGGTLNGVAAAWGGFIPARIGASPPGLAPVWLTPLTATFVHANLVHLAFNLIIFAFCGRPTENVLGPGALAILYVVGAYAAAAAHYALAPHEITPMIGASGGIAAVIGAYSMLFGRNKVKVASPRLALWLNALWLMAAWVVLQLIVGLTFASAGIQVAIAAHVGGFLVGVGLAYPLLLIKYRTA